MLNNFILDWQAIEQAGERALWHSGMACIESIGIPYKKTANDHYASYREMQRLNKLKTRCVWTTTPAMTAMHFLHLQSVAIIAMIFFVVFAFFVVVFSFEYKFASCALKNYGIVMVAWHLWCSISVSHPLDACFHMASDECCSCAAWPALGTHGGECSGQLHRPSPIMILFTINGDMNFYVNVSGGLEDSMMIRETTQRRRNLLFGYVAFSLRLKEIRILIM